MANQDPLPDDFPYAIDRRDDRHAVVRFAEICDHERTKDREQELDRLVASCDQIVCDLSSTHTIISGWIRLLERLSVDAENQGKRFVVAGMSDAVRESADLIGVGSRLRLVKTIDEGWED